MRPLVALPKAHLHLHLEGGMRPETLSELAGSYGMAVPPIRGYGSFGAFADMYLTACEVLRTPADLARVVREAVLDAAEAGAVWFEPSLYPLIHADRLGPAAGVLEIVLDASRAAARETGIGVGWQIAGDRTVDPALTLDMAELAAAHSGAGVVAFGLVNDEVGHPPEPFAPAFQVARDAGLISAPHAGELAGADSIRGALDALGAQRIQHGVRAVDDPALVERLAAERICLDVCPTSNLALGVVKDLAEHPLPRLLSAGVPCSVNGDDPLLFGSGLLDEYARCREEMGMDDAALARVAADSLTHCGAPDDLKAAGLRGVAAWIASGPSA